MKRLLIIFFLLFSVCAFAQTSVPTYELITVSGTDTYTATVSPSPALVNGYKKMFKFTNANSGAATFNLNSTGAVTLRKNDGTALSSGDIPAGSVWWLVYDGTASQWRLTGGSGSALTLTPGSGTTVGGDLTSVDLGGTLTGDAITTGPHTVYFETTGASGVSGIQAANSSGGVASIAGFNDAANSKSFIQMDNAHSSGLSTIQFIIDIENGYGLGTGAFFVDPLNKGIQYGGAGYVTQTRSLTDKGYVDTGLAAKQNTITFGTGVQTALGVNVGSAGAFVVNGGALGTPSSGDGSNLSGLWKLASGGTLTGTNTITAGTNPLIFTSGVTTGTGSTAGMEMLFNDLSSGTGLDISSNSTAAAGNTQTLLGLLLSGANATSTQTTYAFSASNTHTGTLAVNIGVYGAASGGTTNWAGYFANNVFIGGKLSLTSTATLAPINLSPLSSDPSTLTSGDIWYNTALSGGALRWRRGSTTHYIMSTDGLNSTSKVPYSTTSYSLASTNVFSYDGALIGIASAVSTGAGATSGFRLVANGLTTGTAAEKSTSSLTTGFLSNHISTSTVVNHTVGTHGVVGINVSGANSTSAKTVIGLHSKVTNTNATSGTNIAAVLSASGATTANYALWAIGNIQVVSGLSGRGINVNAGGSFSNELNEQGLSLLDGAVNSSIGIASGGGIILQAGIGGGSVTDSYFDVDNGDLYLRASIAAGTGKVRLSGADGVHIESDLTLPSIGNKIKLKEGSGGFMGQATLTSGTNAITVSGVTTSTRCFATMVTPSGTTLTTSYQCVCTANTVTLQANVAAGTINTADGSTLNYILFEPAP